MKNRTTSPYNGQTLYGKVHVTFVRGNVIFDVEKGGVVEKPQGIWLKPSHLQK
jgi:dihydroorotase-like cyclic amidohydrolase